MSRRAKKFIAMVALFSVAMVPAQSYAIGEVTVLTWIFDWAKGQMMDKLHNYTQEQTDKLNDLATDHFNKFMYNENMPGFVKHVLSKVFYDAKTKSLKFAQQQTDQFSDYVNGKGSGVDANQNPAAVIFNINSSFPEVQSQNTTCKLTEPQSVGSNSSQCNERQMLYTNSMIVGVQPIPDFPEKSQNTPEGQQFVLAKKELQTRRNLAMSIISEYTSDANSEFYKTIDDAMASPTADQISKESSQAATRDILVAIKRNNMLMSKVLRAVQNLAVLEAARVGQGEDQNSAYLRKLASSISNKPS